MVIATQKPSRLGVNQIEKEQPEQDETRLYQIQTALSSPPHGSHTTGYIPCIPHRDIRRIRIGITPTRKHAHWLHNADQRCNYFGSLSRLLATRGRPTSCPMHRLVASTAIGITARAHLLAPPLGGGGGGGGCSGRLDGCKVDQGRLYTIIACALWALTRMSCCHCLPIFPEGARPSAS